MISNLKHKSEAKITNVGLLNEICSLDFGENNTTELDIFRAITKGHTYLEKAQDTIKKRCSQSFQERGLSTFQLKNIENIFFMLDYEDCYKLVFKGLIKIIDNQGECRWAKARELGYAEILVYHIIFDMFERRLQEYLSEERQFYNARKHEIEIASRRDIQVDKDAYIAGAYIDQGSV